METKQFEKTVIKDILEIVCLPSWNTHAYICKDGTIYIQLILGRCHTKEGFLKHTQENGIPGKKKERTHFIDSRMKLFDDLQEYYKEKIKNIKDASGCTQMTTG